MESELGSPSAAADQMPVHGYPRAAVDEFLAGAETERARLEAVIREANGRAERARAPIGAQRMMMSMLLDTQRELSELRSGAEARAARIIADAEVQARDILKLADPLPTSSFGSGAGSEHRRSDPDAKSPGPQITATIDLRQAESSGDQPPPDRFGIAPEAAAANGHRTGTESDEFFDFLRGALADDQPLGPRAE